MLTSPSSEVPKGKKNEGKAYIVLYACSLTRGIYLELLPNMETTEFITSLKRFITHRGRPEKIYSDNGKTFVGAMNLLKTIMMDKKVHDYLAKHRIMWQFNLRRAPWWEGERIITHPLILVRFYWLLYVTWRKLTGQLPRNNHRLRRYLSSNCFHERET